MVDYKIRWGHERTKTANGSARRNQRRLEAQRRQTEYDGLTLEQKLERATGQKEIYKISMKIEERNDELAKKAELAEKKKNKKN